MVYAGGAPKSIYKGKVFIFNVYKDSYNKDKIKYYQTIEGSQVGEYFGASLAAADVNNDNLDDLLIGSPHYSSKHDEGRVYIYTGNRNGRLDENIILTGHVYGGRFGSAIQNLGDIDGDGFTDIAIGAPYENNNRGAVYIYNCGKSGINTQPSQIIYAKDISPNLRGFGISFSNAADIDKNGINDFAIGSYLSSQVVLLRTLPVVHIHILVANVGKLNTTATEFEIKACYSVSGYHLPDSIKIKCRVIIDRKHRRAFIQDRTKRMDSDTLEILLIKTQRQCETIKIAIKPNITNHEDPITLVFSPTLAEKQDMNIKNVLWIRGDRATEPDRFCKKCPITYKRLDPPTTKIEVPFSLNCGDDEICDSDLVVQAKFKELNSNNFIIGSKEILFLEISVENINETAYLTNLEVILPSNIYFAETPPFCHNRDVENNTHNEIMICRLGNIENSFSGISTKRKATTLLKIDMKDTVNPETLIFHINVTSRSHELNPDNNIFDLQLSTYIDAQIEIRGNGGKDIFYSDVKHALDFQQQFEVLKTGESPLGIINLDILIPKGFKNSKDLEQNGDTKFLEVYEPTGYQAGQPFSCTSDDKFITDFLQEEKNSEEHLAEFNDQNDNTILRTKRSTGLEKNSNVYGGKTEIVLPPENRTLFLNCSSEEVSCMKISCIIGPFKKNSNTILTLRMTLDLQYLETIMDKKDIVFLSSDGYIKEKDGNRSNKTRISSLFIGNVKEVGVDTWIIIVSCISGFLILFLITGGLVKVGFFNRKKKDELTALKEAEVIKEFEYCEEPSATRSNISEEDLVKM